MSREWEALLLVSGLALVVWTILDPEPMRIAIIAVSFGSVIVQELWQRRRQRT